ncbi:M20/M25/M40 family metallo-hydrolase [Hymenobacter metallicola]|uniref:M20/M25/M40 family metallo-hydrolase n=1 Tax=Hymenobacter metallicola TaxID=2563114 RepID=A0A4Z0QIG9_9BACT|nr:M20/M25/M40 family metallo-hydrolase [Hymenobacter metallicola]TGE29099.1 M20/M25/M40 family metallo-hydrolase [Hymenobacter metallicola]
MQKFPPIVLFFILVSSGLFAQKKAAPTTTTPAVSAATVERVARALASDDMQGRASTQPGGLKAAQFLAAEFQRIGLQPLPGLTSYEQVFPVYETKTAALYVTINGTTVPQDKSLLVSGQSHLNWTDTDEPAARVMVIGPQTLPNQIYRQILEPTENLIVILDPAHAEAFQRLANRTKKGKIQVEKPGPFSCVVVLTPTPNGAIKYQVAANTTVRPIDIRNVVGVLPGQDNAKAAEMVVFSAHYDHLGQIEPVAGDNIANGADDDASGTTAVVALAEYFKQKNDNARTLVFAAFTAEEIGGFGSQHFSRQLDAKQIMAMFNIEMIGKQAKFGPNTAFITGFDKSDFGKLLQRNLTGSSFRFEPDPYPEQNLFYRSDNATLARLGVPAHTISTDQIPTDKRYHSVDDEIESLDLANMTAVINAIARSSAGIVSGQQTPTRINPEAVGQRP